jgi:hypothetical protein
MSGPGLLPGAAGMDWLQFIAAMTGHVVSLAWPVAVFGVIFLFRKELAKWLPWLRVKHKDWEAWFERIEKAVQKEKADAPKVEGKGFSLSVTDEESSSFRELARLAPSQAILEEMKTLEVDIRALAVALDKNYASLTVRGMTNRLQKRGAISPELAQAIYNLYTMAAEAESDTGGEHFDEEDALRYRANAREVGAQLYALFQKTPAGRAATQK